MNEVKFGGTSILIDGVVCAKVTSYTESKSISEEDVTGSEDLVAGADILDTKFVSISRDKTADIEGIVIEGSSDGRDDGQSALKDAADTGAIVVVRHLRATGHGEDNTGFFTKYEESGDTSGVYTFKGSFRINSQETVTPGS